MIIPPAKLGILGSGQLGQMFTQSAVQSGFTVLTYSPDSSSPAEKAGANSVIGEYTDFKKLKEFLDSVQAVSFEFENIPSECLDYLLKYEEEKNLNFFSPSPRALQIAQDRILEKNFFRFLEIPTVNFLLIDENTESIPSFTYPAILKTTKWGYDGKGQWKIETPEKLKEFLEKNPPSETNRYILEAVFSYEYELSVIYARNQDGKEFIFPPVKNDHKNHILDLTEFPAPVSEVIHDKCISITSSIGTNLNYVGVLAVEFFVAEDIIVANEFAPRPHNSGHFSQDASDLSQFDLQLIAMIGGQFPENNRIQPALMKNILGGEHYQESIRKAFDLMGKDSRYKLHLYQKLEAKTGRKMGHLNYIGRRADVSADFFSL